jgi:hypothetical protein
MNSKELKQSLPTPLHKDKYFVCHYCLKQFKSETRYLTHECEDMRRDRELKSGTGHFAYTLYLKWLKFYNRRCPNITSFGQSKYYKAFIKFAKFAQDVKLPDPNHFVRWACLKDYTVHNWLSQDVYGEYLCYLDRQYPPLNSVKITIDYIYKLVDAAECEPEEVYDLLLPGEFIDLIYKRKFSPWFLLNSTKFTQYFVKNFNQEQRIILEGLINADFWRKQFAKYPSEVIQIKSIVKEMKL